MFENLSDRLERSFKILKGEGKITEINVAETLKDVRRALLDAAAVEIGLDVVVLGDAKGCEGLLDDELEVLVGEVVLQITAVNFDLALTCGEVYTSNGSFTPAECVSNFCHRQRCRLWRGDRQGTNSL